MSRSRQRSRSRSCRHCRQLDSVPSRRAAEIGTSAHMGPKKPVREPLSIPGPARKNEIAGQTPYCADFLRLVHDEMLSAARAGRAGADASNDGSFAWHTKSGGQITRESVPGIGTDPDSDSIAEPLRHTLTNHAMTLIHP